MLQNETMLKTSDVARLLNVRPATIRLMVTRGRLPVIRLSSKTLRFRPAEVERVLKAHHKKSTSA